MNIGAVGIQNYHTGSRNHRASQKHKAGNYSSKAKQADSHIVLHGIYGETDSETGATVVGAWGDAVAGTSTTVYRPKDFDVNHPVYQMKIWDKEGNVTERTVDINELDPRNCDAYDLYAYCCHASSTGEYPSAMTDFMRTHALGRDGQEICGKTDWLEVIKGIMRMQYDLGNIGGYMDFKNFFDFLERKS